MSGKPPDISSWTLATIEMWTNKMPDDEVMSLIEKHMSFDVLWDDGAIKINELELVQNKSVMKIPKSTSGRTRDLAKNLLDRVKDLKNIHSVKFIVSCDQLEWVPGTIKAADSAVDQVAVSTRLDTLEKSQEEVIKMLKELQQSQLRPSLQSTEASSAVNVPSIKITAPSFSDVAAASVPPKANISNQVRSRSTSASSKRSRSETEGESNEKNDKWKDVNRKRKPKVQHGVNKIEVTNPTAVTPYDVVIGNTHPDSDKDIIIDVLIDVSKHMPDEMKLDSDLEIIDAIYLTKPREDGSKPWSKSWQVRVPQKFRDHIMRPEAIPAGWTSRRFFPPRPKKPSVPDLHPAKRVNTSQVETVKAAAAPKYGEPGYLPPGAQSE